MEIVYTKICFAGEGGVGKTTIARLLEKELKSKGYKVESMDGDEVRKWLSPTEGFTPEDRARQDVFLVPLFRPHDEYVHGGELYLPPKLAQSFVEPSAKLQRIVGVCNDYQVYIRSHPFGLSGS